MAQVQSGQSIEELREQYLNKVRAVEIEASMRYINNGGEYSPDTLPQGGYSAGINYEAGKFYFTEASFTQAQLNKYPNIIKNYADNAVNVAASVQINTGSFAQNGRIMLPTGNRACYCAAMCKHIQERGGVRKSELFGILDLNKFDISIRSDNPDAAYLRKDLLYYLDILHSKAGYIMQSKKLYITSGYRSPYYNYDLYSRMGGDRVYWSPHMGGYAVDISTGNTSKSVELARVARSIGFGGVGVGETYVHIDIGPYGSWRYGSAPKVD